MHCSARWVKPDPPVAVCHHQPAAPTCQQLDFPSSPARPPSAPILFLYQSKIWLNPPSLGLATDHLREELVGWLICELLNNLIWAPLKCNEGFRGVWCWSGSSPIIIKFSSFHSWPIVHKKIPNWWGASSRQRWTQQQQPPFFPKCSEMKGGRRSSQFFLLTIVKNQIHCCPSNWTFLNTSRSNFPFLPIPGFLFSNVCLKLHFFSANFVEAN